MATVFHFAADPVRRSPKAVIQRPPSSVACHSRCPTDDQLRCQHGDDRLGAARIELLGQGGHGAVGLFEWCLADGGQIEVAEPGQRAVVVAGYGDLERNFDTGSPHRVENADGYAVIGGDHCGRQLGCREERFGCDDARCLGEVESTMWIASPLQCAKPATRY